MEEKKDRGRKKYIFAGGGTAGHVNPALAVAKALQKMEPEAYILFLASHDGLEKDLVAEAGFDYELIHAEALPENKWKYPGFLWHNLRGFLHALKILRNEPVTAVLGTGGYVSAPLIMAAKHAAVPAYLHEQNAFPGRSNRFLAQMSEAVCLSFAASQEFFENAEEGKFYHTGNPIKQEFYTNRKAEIRKSLGLSPEQKVVVAVGGSLGAKSLNQAVEGLPDCPAWEKFIEQNPDFLLLLSTGKINKRFVKAAPQDEHLRFMEYIDTSAWLPAADLLVGRASGGFLAEAAATGQASILLPFPEAAENHQMRNAQVFEQAGASLILEDKDLNSEILLDYLEVLLADTVRLETMRKAAKNLAREEAAEKIACLMTCGKLEDDAHAKTGE